MTSNDILRRIRYTFDFNNRKMLEIFALAGYEAKPSQIIAWLQKDGDPDLVELSDNELAYFLNGFINEKRGKKEGEQPVPETTLNNNIILRKLKIALNLKIQMFVSKAKEKLSSAKQAINWLCDDLVRANYIGVAVMGWFLFRFFCYPVRDFI